MADNQPDRIEPQVEATNTKPDAVKETKPDPYKEENTLASKKGLEEVRNDLYSGPGKSGVTGADDAIVQTEVAGAQLADTPPGEMSEADRSAKFGDGRGIGTGPGQRHPVTLEVNPEGGEDNPHNLALDKDGQGNYSLVNLDFNAELLGLKDTANPGATPGDDAGGDNPESRAIAAKGKDVADKEGDDNDDPSYLAGDGDDDPIADPTKEEVKEDGGSKVVTASKKEGGEAIKIEAPPEGETEKKQDKAGSGGGTVSGSGSGTTTRARGVSTESRMDSVEGKKPTSDGNGTAALNEQLDRLKAGGFIKDGQDGRFQSGDSLKDAGAKQGFGKQLNDFLARKDITDQQKADALRDVTDVLSMKDSPYSQGFREAQMTSLMEDMAKWDSIDQGNSNRCNVYQVSSASSYLKPDTMAARAKNIMQDGKWDIPASESSTGKAQSVDMRDVLDKQVADYNAGRHRTTDGANGQSTMHGDLDTIAMAKLFNQERGLIYSIGDKTATNPTGEYLHRIERNADNSYAKNADGSLKKGALHSEGSPGMTAADVADLAKNPALKIQDQVTVTADQTWRNGRSTDNLTVLGNGPGQKTMDQVAKDIQSKDKHYLIMHVAGNDKAVVDANGQSHARGAGSHAGHSIGAAWNKNVNINEGRFAAGTPEGGAWKGNNTWGGGNDDIWDKNIVGSDGKLKSDMVAAASKMDTNRGGGGGGSVPYQDWHRENPGVNKDGGTIQRDNDKDSNKGREDHKKQQEKEQANKEKEQQKEKELGGKDPLDQQRKRAQLDARSRAQVYQQQYLAEQATVASLAGRSNLDAGGQARLDAAKSAAELYKGLASDVFRSA